MSVTLRKRKNTDGSTTLRIDIYHEGKRWVETLKDLKLCKPSSVFDRQSNKEKIDLAERIAAKRSEELASNDYNIASKSGRKTIVTEWMQAYVDNYKKKDVRNMQGVLNRFKKFLKENNNECLSFGHLTDILISDFQDYLRAISVGEGASSYFRRFKKMVKHAYKLKLLPYNPAADVPTIGGAAAKKDTLTLSEITLLSQTPTQNISIKNAFLFSCVTGLRWIDVKALTWQSINVTSRYINIRQSKTEKVVRINLNDTALKLLPNRGKENEIVFTLPSSNGANKTLKAWIKRAGIDKKITWHNGRHSFGTNLIYQGADVITTSALLGHSTLKHTERYVKSADEMKQNATNKLNFL